MDLKECTTHYDRQFIHRYFYLWTKTWSTQRATLFLRVGDWLTFQVKVKKPPLMQVVDSIQNLLQVVETLVNRKAQWLMSLRIDKHLTEVSV